MAEKFDKCCNMTLAGISFENSLNVAIESSDSNVAVFGETLFGSDLNQDFGF